MDTLSRKILTAGQKIITELRSLGTTLLGIQKQIESIAEQNQTQHQREYAPPVLRAELQIPESVEQKRETENAKKIRFEWYSLTVSVLTLTAVAIYALINYHMLF